MFAAALCAALWGFSLLAPAWGAVPTLPGQAMGYCEHQRKVECAFQEEHWTPPPPRAPAAAAETPKRRILVFMVGVKERLYPISALRHIVAPAVRAGHIVDYYTILSTKTVGPDSWRSFWYQPMENPDFANFTDADLEEYLTRRARFYGARRVGIHLLPNNVEIDPLPQHIFTGKRFLGEKHGLNGEDVFTSSGTFWLFLKRLKKVEMLWNWTVAHRMVTEYDTVVWTRSDAYWIDDLHLSHFPDPYTIYSRSFGALCSKDMSGRLVSDQSIVMGARVAHHILTSYSTFYNDEDPRLNGAGCSEGFMQAVAQVKGIRWQIVRQDWFPFFLALHMRPADGQEPVLCFRGLSKKRIFEPRGECVHPSLIKAPLCDDFELI